MKWNETLNDEINLVNNAQITKNHIFLWAVFIVVLSDYGKLINKRRVSNSPTNNIVIFRIPTIVSGPFAANVRWITPIWAKRAYQNHSLFSSSVADSIRFCFVVTNLFERVAKNGTNRNSYYVHTYLPMVATLLTASVLPEWSRVRRIV